MPSLKLPSVTDVAIATVDEVLAFTALPYYQVSGNLKSGEGAVVVGDPVAWDVAAGKWLIFDANETQITDEAVGTGDGTNKEFFLVNGNIIPGSVTVEVDSVAKTENVDYWLDYVTGYLKFAAAPGNTLAVEATYKWAENAEEDLGKCLGFVRIPGDSTSADAPIEVVVGGAVKYSIVSARDNWSTKIIDDLKARYVVAADALIF